jgi:hypothetical protein
MLPANVDVVDRKELLAIVVKKTIVVDGSMRCGHSSSSRMLEGKACVVSVDVAVWKPMARRCVDIVPSDSRRSCSRGEVTRM